MRIDTVLVELIDTCNLNCPYCLRDESSLHGRANPLAIPDLRRVLSDLKGLGATCRVVFSGGEPTLHPEFAQALQVVRDLNWTFTVITNGWAFERVLPSLLDSRESLEAVAFSIDGTDAPSHDEQRGQGSFRRLMKGVLSCRRHKLPFRLKLTVNRRNFGVASDMAFFAARLGAVGLEISPLLPTDPRNRELVLSREEQVSFLAEIRSLRAIFTMPILVAAGFYDPNPEPTCDPLLGKTLNLDYHGNLTLCTVLAGFRGGSGKRDLVAGLKETPLAAALPRLDAAIARRNDEHRATFANEKRSRPPLRLGSPCFDCLYSFGKMPWAANETERDGEALPENATFAPVSSVIASEFDGKEGLLLDTATQRYCTLNETATFIWSGMEQGLTVRELSAALTLNFDVSEEKAQGSVRDVIRRLETDGLIQRKDRHQ